MDLARALTKSARDWTENMRPRPAIGFSLEKLGAIDGGDKSSPPNIMRASSAATIIIPKNGAIAFSPSTLMDCAPAIILDVSNAVSRGASEIALQQAGGEPESAHGRGQQCKGDPLARAGDLPLFASLFEPPR